MKGIVTALHGVLGCTKTDATGATSAFKNLTIKLVDTKRDLAVLSSDELEASPAEGLVASTKVTQDLTVLGHPHGIAAQLASHLSTRNPSRAALQLLVPVRSLVALKPRGSPDIETSVLSVEGHLTLGHSGAPVLNSDEKVIAIANGGLEDGALEISWAIPVDALDMSVAFDWETPIQALADLQRIALFPARNVFAMAEGNVASLGSVSCFGLTLDPIKAMSLAELIDAADDRNTAQQLATIYQIDRDPLEFVVYRDRGAQVTLVIPNGWTLTSAGTRCIARSSDPDLSAAIELLSLPAGPAPLKAATVLASDKEYRDFCNKGYVVDPTASNWRGVPQPAKGIIVQRKSYAMVDSKCGVPYLDPSIVNTAPWNAGQAPQIWPRGPYQCAPGSCAMPGWVSYPQFWATMQLPVPSGLLKAAGFASFVASEKSILAVTITMTNSAALTRYADCMNSMSTSAACKAEYAKQKIWAAGVLAAAACTLNTL